VTELLDEEQQWDEADLADARGRLRAAGLWRDGLALEPFQWLDSLAPTGALDRVRAYRLIDTEAAPPRGEGWRNWQPLLIGDDLAVGPSPEMLRSLLRASGFFDAPQDYGHQLLLQFHRFALDFYDGYQVREDAFEAGNGQLVVRGRAYRGEQQAPFVTVATRDGVTFEVTPVPPGSHA
jgi:hypothetical protein